MFSSKKKLDSNLKNCLSKKTSSNYRVLIKCKNFKDHICKKISSYKGDLIHDISTFNILCANLNSRGIERLLEFPEVEYIALDEYLFLCGMSLPTANKVRFPNNFTLSGKGIGIGIIDSGVYPHHDLITPSNKIISFKDLINGLNYPYDDNGHGTSTCGIICGNGTSSNGMYKGVAPECSIHCYKAFDKLGKGFASDILFSLYSLIQNSKEHNIKVISLPCELLNYNSFIVNQFEIMFQYAVINNITIVIPSGSNRNIEGSITGIANSPNCITVSGLDTRGNVSPYEFSSAGISKKGTKPDLCAACVDIVSLNCNTNYISEKNNIKIYPQKLDTSYRSFTGTSISSCYVAGLCCLLYENNNNLTFKDIRSLLELSSELIDDIPVYNQGFGKININKVLK